MEINADFGKRAFAHAQQLDWVASPMPGVERKMLDRIGAEVARATSIVRYAPGSHFSEHTHSGGEEFIVLEGIFQDEHADYPAGSYVRNPIGTRHTPRSDDGCTIFVKLWQFDRGDTKQFSIDMNALRRGDCGGGIRCVTLHRFGNELVTHENWAAGHELELGDDGGAEILVLSGDIVSAGENYSAMDWLRLPPGDSLVLQAGSAGAKLWIKRGHLSAISLPT